MSLAPSLWADLYDNASGLVEAVDFLGTYSEPSLAVLDAIAAAGAWIDDNGPHSLRRSRVGTTHAYLADLLLQAFLAWQARAIFVLCEADCPVLVDIASFVVEGNRPRPFPIPDLRSIVQRDDRSVSGKLSNLRHESISDVEKARGDRRVQDFANRLRTYVDTLQLCGFDEFTSAELANAPSHGTQPQETDGIAIAIEDAETLNNEGVQVALHNKALARMSLRKFSTHTLRLLILVE